MSGVWFKTAMTVALVSWLGSMFIPIMNIPLLGSIVALVVIFVVDIWKD